MRCFGVIRSLAHEHDLTMLLGDARDDLPASVRSGFFFDKGKIVEQGDPGGLHGAGTGKDEEFLQSVL